MSKQLRQALVKLGSVKPELRPAIRPILDALDTKKAAGPSDSARSVLGAFASEAIISALTVLVGRSADISNGKHSGMAKLPDGSYIHIYVDGLTGVKNWGSMNFIVTYNNTNLNEELRKEVFWAMNDSMSEVIRSIVSTVQKMGVL